MTSGDVALQIGRALWLTHMLQAVQRTVHELLGIFGIPYTPEFQAHLDEILTPLYVKDGWQHWRESADETLDGSFDGNGKRVHDK